MLVVKACHQDARWHCATVPFVCKCAGALISPPLAHARPCALLLPYRKQAYWTATPIHQNYDSTAVVWKGSLGGGPNRKGDNGWQV